MHRAYAAPEEIVGAQSMAVPVAVALTTFMLGYALLEKKLLPRRWWAALSRFYFYPMMMPTYLLRRARRQPHFSDVDAGVILGAVPLVLAGHVQALHDDRVRAIVNMQAEYPGPLAAYAALQPPIEQLHIPVVDHTEPSLAQLEQAVDFIARRRARGERVLIHCKGGHGRSAAVAMAWLMSGPGGSLTPEAAQVRLSSIRHVRTALHKQPAVLAFYKKHGAKCKQNK
jgi:atypical dual specificity phosphatase